MSAPYHTQGCTGHPGCRCLADHQEWEADCASPTAFDLIAYAIAVGVSYAFTLIVVFGVAGYVWARWGDAISNFLTN